MAKKKSTMAEELMKSEGKKSDKDYAREKREKKMLLKKKGKK